MLFKSKFANIPVVLYYMYMKKNTRGLFSVIAVGLCLSVALVSAPTYAEEGSSDGGGSKCGDTATFFDWGCSDGSGDNQILNVLGTILNWLAVGVSVAVLIGIVYGAVMYASAGGNEAQTKKAIGIIRNAIIALILYFAMWAILQYLIPGGVFSGSGGSS